MKMTDELWAALGFYRDKDEWVSKLWDDTFPFNPDIVLLGVV